MSEFPLVTLNPNDTAAALSARMPHFDDPRKAEYLVLRSVKFTHDEALNMVGLTYGLYTAWTAEDLEFKRWQGVDSLQLLHRGLGEEVLRAKFMRNVFLLLAIDSELMTKRFTDPDDMSEDEKSELKDALKRYSAPNINVMLKALEPEREQNQTTHVGEIKFNVHIGDRVVSDRESRRAGARALYEQFFEKRDNQGNEIIDAESSVVKTDD